MYNLIFIDSTWESKEIKSNTSIPVVGAAADFKYLIRVPKQELDSENGESSDSFTHNDKRRWNGKNHQSYDNDSDDDSDGESDEEEIVILRCQTSICQDGDKCVPLEFDFVVHVHFGDENDAPQAADTYFPYTLPFTPSGNKSSVASTKVNTSVSNAPPNNSEPSMESTNTASASTNHSTNKPNDNI